MSSDFPKNIFRKKSHLIQIIVANALREAYNEFQM